MEGAKAQEQAARDEMLAAYLTLTSNVANAAVQQASLRAQIEATKDLVEINAKIPDTMNYQLSKAGG